MSPGSPTGTTFSRTSCRSLTASSRSRALELFREGRETPPLSVVHARFGKTFGAVERRRLECPWGAKGRVMRGLAERFGADADAILTDGVKLNLEGVSWVLMLPDPDNPLFYVYAEGSVEANELAESSMNGSDGGSYTGGSDESEVLVS